MTEAGLVGNSAMIDRMAPPDESTALLADGDESSSNDGGEVAEAELKSWRQLRRDIRRGDSNIRVSESGQAVPSPDAEDFLPEPIEMKGFRRYAMHEMREMSRSESGLALLNDASTSGKDVTVRPRFGGSADTDIADGELEANASPSADGSPGAGVATDIYIDPWATDMWVLGEDEKTKIDAPMETNLAHEFGHATRMAHGTEPPAPEAYDDPRSEDELAAIEQENLVRADLGMPQRGATHEGGGDDAATRQAVGYEEWRKSHRRLPR